MGDAFLTAHTVGASVRVARIELDGSRVAPFSDLGRGPIDERLAMTSSGPVLIYWENREGLGSFVRLDSRGVPLTTALLPAIGNSFGTMIGFGSDVLLATSSGGGRWFGSPLSFVRLDATGKLVSELEVGAVPGALVHYQVAQRGPDAIVGWVSPEGLGLARVEP